MRPLSNVRPPGLGVRGVLPPALGRSTDYVTILSEWKRLTGFHFERQLPPISNHSTPLLYGLAYLLSEFELVMPCRLLAIIIAALVRIWAKFIVAATLIGKNWSVSERIARSRNRQPIYSDYTEWPLNKTTAYHMQVKRCFLVSSLSDFDLLRLFHFIIDFRQT